MNDLLKDIEINGFLKPGQVYVLSEADRNRRLDGVEYIYTIRSDEEVFLALDMEISGLEVDGCRFKKVVGHKKLSEDSYLFRFMCREKGASKDELFYFYLHRLNTLQEHLAYRNELTSE